MVCTHLLVNSIVYLKHALETKLHREPTLSPRNEQRLDLGAQGSHTAGPGLTSGQHCTLEGAWLWVPTEVCSQLSVADQAADLSLLPLVSQGH